MSRLGMLFMLGALAWITAGCQTSRWSFRDDFRGSLRPGWVWIRENPSNWRVAQGALEIRVEPGNMWGPANDAKNVLVRPVPGAERGPIEVTVVVENRPTEQYEQVDLVWYYDDSHMVKLGQEQVDGRLSVVMGREEDDRTRTIAIVPLASFRVELQLVIDREQIRGRFRPAAAPEWVEAGQCDLPARGSPKISIQAYQGPAAAEHWARISQFRARSRLKSSNSVRADPSRSARPSRSRCGR